MAKLYRMTLYICDLEGNLDIEEIQSLIHESLNGCATNCGTHFSGAETSSAEWEDDIDLNKCDATDATWNAYFKKGD